MPSVAQPCAGGLIRPGRPSRGYSSRATVVGAAGFNPRPKQQEVLAYSGGRMGIAAVPGSGKTVTLSYLAARLVAEADLRDDQEVLVVTFANSAVDNFNQRLSRFMRQRGLLPGIGYRVRTLHGLAHDIVRQQPGLVGLSEDFVIVDDRDCERLLVDAASSWLRAHPDLADKYLVPGLSESRRRYVLANDWQDTIREVAQAVVRRCKDRGVGVTELRSSLDPEYMPLLAAGCDIYESYQRGLVYHGGVDFQDLIRLALRVLELDWRLLERLRDQWPYVLEDEAQDSSQLQERILRLLTGEDGNWVRVGDPNQAIYESFTTASPRFLREFLQEPGVQARDLPNSGRSTKSIMSLANYLIGWVQTDHPNSDLHDALAPPYIEPAPPGDSQPNPTDCPERIAFIGNFTADDELDKVVNSLTGFLREHPDQTVAVLVPSNPRGAKMVTALQRRGLPCLEMLHSSTGARQAAGWLSDVAGYLDAPLDRSRLAKVVALWADLKLPEAGLRDRVKALAKALQRYPFPEAFPYPTPGTEDCMGTLAPEANPETLTALGAVRQLLRRWLGAAQLPVDQMLLSVAQDLFTRPADLAVAHKLAVLLRRAGEVHPDWRLTELNAELRLVAESKRSFRGLSEEDTGFDPDSHKGIAVVTTMHKAKGLEWDRVYLTSVNNYDFPAVETGDRFRGERDCLRDGVNLQAEAEALLRAALDEGGMFSYEEGVATREGRLDYARERLRLLYVGITRARRELIVTWNTGSKGNMHAALAFTALATWWKEQRRVASA